MKPLFKDWGPSVLDTTRKFEYGNDLRMLNVPTSLLNAVQRNARHNRQFELPLRINIDDMEEYETSQDVRVSVVYCIDLSSTMRYSSMFGDLSRIEAAKKALWGLFLFNKKFFPSDSISVIGFGALASPIPAETSLTLRLLNRAQISCITLITRQHSD